MANNENEEDDFVGIPDAEKAADSLIRPVWTVLSKGRTGTGKTILSCGKEFRPTYVFNLDGRFNSVMTYYKRLDGHIKGIEKNDFTIASGFKAMDKKMDAIIARPEYTSVVIASLTSFIHIVMQNLMGVTARGKGRFKGGIQTNILEDFNFEDAAIIHQLISFCQECNRLGINTFLEAHITPYEYESIENGERIVRTINQILTKGKKAPAQIPLYFNEVWLFEKEFIRDDKGKLNMRHTVNTMGTPEDECKTSFGIPSFQWTGQDASHFLMNQLSKEIKETPRIDPNQPRRVVV
jgi:hypothetical protein